jgi:hypothetical protein
MSEIEIKHPLPVGTTLRAAKQHTDHGIMSWDDNDVEIARVAVPGSVGHIWDVEKGNDGYRYHVTFFPSEVWNVLEEPDFKDHPEDYSIVELGDGTHSDAYKAYWRNPERDPEAIRKIEEATAPSVPSL